MSFGFFNIQSFTAWLKEKIPWLIIIYFFLLAVSRRLVFNEGHNP